MGKTSAGLPALAKDGAGHSALAMVARDSHSQEAMEHSAGVQPVQVIPPMGRASTGCSLLEGTTH